MQAIDPHEQLEILKTQLAYILFPTSQYSKETIGKYVETKYHYTLEELRSELENPSNRSKPEIKLDRIINFYQASQSIIIEDLLFLANQLDETRNEIENYLSFVQKPQNEQDRIIKSLPTQQAELIQRTIEAGPRLLSIVHALEKLLSQHNE